MTEQQIDLLGELTEDELQALTVFSAMLGERLDAMIRVQVYVKPY